jgi:DNA-binding LytR/AlgR family response regulator
MIRCIIIDDEPYARKLLEEFIARTPGLTLIAACSNALEAHQVLSSTPADVLFLDIQMPDLTGIEFLKTLADRPAVVMTTAYAEYALEGYELDVVDYLLKPFDFNRFLRAVNKVALRKPDVHVPPAPATEEDTYIFVKDSNKLVRVNFDSVLYIKGAREYVTIVTRDKKITTLQSMKDLERDLPSIFIRIHNSFIVNTNFISEVHKDDVLVNQELLPIGVSYKKDFLARVREKLRE